MKTNDRVIIVMDSGWVFVGNYAMSDDKNTTFNDVSNIRVWGTTAGLGELAMKGKTGSTVLDPVGKLLAPNNKIIFLIPVLSEL